VKSDNRRKLKGENMDAKKWYESKTFWFGVAYVVLGVGSAVLNYFGYADFQPSAGLVEGVAVATGVIVVILRLITKKPVE
jgi:uncharacterized membrane protein